MSETDEANHAYKPAMGQVISAGVILSDISENASNQRPKAYDRLEIFFGAVVDDIKPRSLIFV